jgi:hypothetical protein
MWTWDPLSRLQQRGVAEGVRADSTPGSMDWV